MKTTIYDDLPETADINRACCPHCKKPLELSVYDDLFSREADETVQQCLDWDCPGWLEVWLVKSDVDWDVGSPDDVVMVWDTARLLAVVNEDGEVMVVEGAQ